LNILDALMTYYAVCVYGVASELNPLYNPANPLPKLVGVVVYVCCWFSTRRVCEKFPSRPSSLVVKFADYSLYALAGIYVAVFANKVAMLIKLFLS